MSTSIPVSAVFGCAGPELTPEEHAFFRSVNPLGFILFRRNCRDPEQVRRLVDDLRACVGREDAPILIDQEGGRVARLRPPHWPAYPSMRRLGDLANADPEAGAEATWIDARLLAHALRGLGITVDCAPVCDVPVDGAHDVIGDRAFASDPNLVAGLARVFCLGLLDGGVLPVIKHLPGHGRAIVDSHLELPVVEASRVELARSDFIPFEVVADMPCGMVAHVIYEDIDPARPASISPTIVGDVVRGALGFDGLLFSDDMSMQALAGSMAERARGILDAGCDVVLHCNGNMAEMREVAAALDPLSPVALIRWERARTRLGEPSPIDPAALHARLEELIGGMEAA